MSSSIILFYVAKADELVIIKKKIPQVPKEERGFHKVGYFLDDIYCCYKHCFCRSALDAIKSVYCTLYVRHPR